jgi:hypothetical protein
MKRDWLEKNFFIAAPGEYSGGIVISLEAGDQAQSVDSPSKFACLWPATCYGLKVVALRVFGVFAAEH